MTPLGALRLPARRDPPRTRFLMEAAVAIVLRGPSLDAAEVLLVRRAHRAGDPWSGDMAFPGGRRAPYDADALVTAMRETREEIGVALDSADLLGELAPGYTMAPRAGLPRVLPMVVRPFVF